MRSILKSNDRIYLDYAAATPMHAVAKRELIRGVKAIGNPGSIHKEGVEQSKALECARDAVARCIRCRSSEIIFTSGGTEAISMTVFGLAYAAKERLFKTIHVIAITNDHASVTQALMSLEKNGVGNGKVEIDFVPVKDNGTFATDTLMKMIRPETVAICMSRVNGEIGVIHQTREIYAQLEAWKMKQDRRVEDFPYMVVDACQSPVCDTSDRQKIGGDIIIFDSTKCYGPAGVGVMMKQHDAPFVPMIVGGGQENGMRSGTPPVASISAFAKVFEYMHEHRDAHTQQICALRDEYVEQLTVIAKEARRELCIHGNIKKGDTRRHAAHIVNVCIDGLESEMFVLRLDAEGVAASYASACASASGEGISEVIARTKKDCATSSVRFSFGIHTTPRDIRRALKKVAKLLKMW